MPLRSECSILNSYWLQLCSFCPYATVTSNWSPWNNCIAFASKWEKPKDQPSFPISKSLACFCYDIYISFQFYAAAESLGQMTSPVHKGSPTCFFASTVNDLVVLGRIWLLILSTCFSSIGLTHKMLEEEWRKHKEDSSSAWGNGKKFQRSGDVWACGLCLVSQKWERYRWWTSMGCCES